jgi:AcrR family transcriptional regulator
VPKNVDHDARRADLLEAVWRVIARDGLDHTTIRSLARETGWSAGVLAHYFADKDDILTSALRLAHERIAARWEEKLAGLNGIDALRELVLDNLPLDDERALETKFLINYWSRAVTRSPGGRSPWRVGPLLVDRLVRLVGEAQERGEIDAAQVTEDVGERLLALIDGLSLHALLDPERVTRERQVAIVEQEFERLRIVRGDAVVRPHQDQE